VSKPRLRYPAPLKPKLRQRLAQVASPPSGWTGDPALYGCVLFYSVSVYDRLDRMTFDEAKAAADAAGEASAHAPLWMRNAKGQFGQYDIPGFGSRSGPYCIALLAAFLVWTQRQLQDFPLPTSPLLSAAQDGLTLWWASHPDRKPSWVS